MGMLDKIKFWEKKEDSFDDPFSSSNDPFGAPPGSPISQGVDDNAPMANQPFGGQADSFGNEGFGQEPFNPQGQGAPGGEPMPSMGEFGNGQNQDPFADSSDPFGGSAGDDPFASGPQDAMGQQQAFENTPSADPFGRNAQGQQYQQYSGQPQQQMSPQGQMPPQGMPQSDPYGGQGMQSSPEFQGINQAAQQRVNSSFEQQGYGAQVGNDLNGANKDLVVTKLETIQVSIENLSQRIALLEQTLRNNEKRW